jgi:hypothetical protein
MTNKIYDYIKYQGGLDQLILGKEPAGNRRYSTMKLAISLFLQRDECKNILETGCQRQIEDWGAGCSSYVFSNVLKEFPEKGQLYSVDISPKNMEVCAAVTEKRNMYYLGDSVGFLRNLKTWVKEPIGLLYLDSLDYELQWQKESQLHQLEEIKGAYDKLNEDSIVLLDDNMFENGGKTKLTKEFLSEKGWTCLLDYDQSIWIYK